MTDKKPSPGDRFPIEKRFKPGQSGNPAGRPPLPAWFRARGPEALQHLVEVATGAYEDPKVSRTQAAIEVIDRIYGRAPQAIDVSTPNLSPAAEALLRLATGGAVPSSNGKATAQ